MLELVEPALSIFSLLLIHIGDALEKLLALLEVGRSFVEERLELFFAAVSFDLVETLDELLSASLLLLESFLLLLGFLYAQINDGGIAIHNRPVGKDFKLLDIDFILSSKIILSGNRLKLLLGGHGEFKVDISSLMAAHLG